MLWNRYFFPSFIVLSAVALLHWIGSDLFFYWTLWWYDVVTHFLGGAWVALATLWVLEMPFLGSVRPRFSMLSVILVTLIVGATWEVYEVFLRFSNVHAAGYVADTLYDLAMDTLGASVVAWVYSRLLTSSQKRS